MLRPNDKILIVGHTGHLGRMLFEHLHLSHNVYGCNSKTPLEQSIKATQPTLIIDFTNAIVIHKHLSIYAKYKIRTLIGTSGLTPLAIKKLILTQSFPLLLVTNFSHGIGHMITQAKQQSSPLRYIYEIHASHKADMPSATALFLKHLLNPNAKIISSRIPHKIASHTLVFNHCQFSHCIQSHQDYLTGILESIDLLTQMTQPKVLVAPPNHEITL